MNSREIAEQIFLAGIESVLPERLLKNTISIVSNTLIISGVEIDLESVKNIYVVGAGKASALMGEEVEKILRDRITDGHIVVKHGYSCKLKYIKVTEAGHPVPDSNGFRATAKIMKIVRKADINDLVICLLSGGGSALLTDFPGGSSPEEMVMVNKLLVNCGAAISEINAVRKHLSLVKGGQLAKAAFPALLVSLILSDVPGDHPDVIASGPTVPDPTTFNQALEVIEKYNLAESLPASVMTYLYEGAIGKRSETPKPDDPVFLNTSTQLIGTNRLALEASMRKSMEYNFNAVIIDDQLQGDTSSVAEYIVKTALKFQSDKNEVKPVCLLFGGEPTVTLKGSGLGGRNQHLAFSAALLLHDKPGITILSAGTDGTDGPTDAAGAVVDSDTVPNALAKNIDPAKYLKEFDSYHFFKKVGGHIITGPTMTNVMDIIVVLIW